MLDSAAAGIVWTTKVHTEEEDRPRNIHIVAETTAARAVERWKNVGMQIDM